MPTRPRVLVSCDPAPTRAWSPLDDDLAFPRSRPYCEAFDVEHRGLREAMLRQIGPADQLKIEQALAQGDQRPSRHCRCNADAGRRVARAWRWAIRAPGRRRFCAGGGVVLTRPCVAGLAGAATRACRSKTPGVGHARIGPRATATQPVSLGGVKVSPETYSKAGSAISSRPRVAASSLSFRCACR